MTPSVLLYLRALVFYTGVLTTLCVFAPLALIIRPLPYRKRYRLIIQNWAHLNVRWLEKSCGVGIPRDGHRAPTRRSRDHLLQAPVGLGDLCAPRGVLTLIWVLKREVLGLPLFGWGLATLAPIAIDRKTGTAALRQILRTGSAWLRSGLGVR